MSAVGRLWFRMTAPICVLLLAGSLPALAAEPAEGGTETEITSSEVQLVTAEPDEVLVDQEGEDFLTAPQERSFAPNLEDYAAARVELSSEVAVIGVTWPEDALQPQQIYLRYQQGDKWEPWEELRVIENDAATGVQGTEEFILAGAQMIEVVALGDGSQLVEDITVHVIDPDGQSPVENSLDTEELLDEPEPQNQPGEPEEPEEAVEPQQVEEPIQEEEADTQLDEPVEEALEDTLLDQDGAFATDPASFTTGSVASAFATNLDGLVINTRADWSANESIMTWKPEPTTFKGAVIHHTEGSNNYTQAAVPGLLRGIQFYHADTLGWGDIGYQFLVDKYGGVWEGRAGGITKMTIGAQAYGGNKETFGISILGSFTNAVPPVVAQNAVAKTIAWKLQLHGINSIDGTIRVPGSDLKGRNVPVVSAHRDIGATDCPGNAYYNIMPQMRTKVKSYMKVGGSSGGGQTSGSVTAGMDKTWPYGNIISDSAFYNGTAMTEAQIQNFLNKVGVNCKNTGDRTCLKSTKFPTSKLTTQRGACKPLNLTGQQTAAKIIAETGKACGLNPQVILVNIQKESSGIYQPLSAAGWAKVMGSACPDGQPCDPAQAGFAKQIYYGTDKLASYRLDTSWPYIAAVRSGKPVTIPFKYNTPSCGNATFVMQNDATASLYTYTPFAPNAAAVNSGGDSCSSPGWVIFRDYMLQWFPDSMVEKTVVPTPKISGTARFGNKLTATGAAAASWTPRATSVSYQWLRGGSTISGATGSTYTLTLADVGKKISVKVTGKTAYSTLGSKTSSSITVSGPTVTRYGGANRYDTSQAVSIATASKNKPLFVATGADFPDALTAGPAVAKVGGSLMLAPTGGLTAAQITQIKKISPNLVYIVGGSGVVSEAVANQLRTATGKVPQRVSGVNRYETSVAVYQKFFQNSSPTTAFVATGRDYPDALSASAAGGALGMPVLLINGTAGRGFSTQFKNTLQTKKMKTLVVAGGSGVVTAGTVNSLKNQGFSVSRLGGINRYETNQAINNWVTTKQPSTAVTGMWVATGADFPDALSGAVPAGKAGQRLVISRSTCLQSVVRQQITASNSKVSRVNLVGGTGVLTSGVAGLNQCG